MRSCTRGAIGPPVPPPGPARRRLLAGSASGLLRVESHAWRPPPPPRTASRGASPARPAPHTPHPCPALARDRASRRHGGGRGGRRLGGRLRQLRAELEREVVVLDIVLPPVLPHTGILDVLVPGGPLLLLELLKLVVLLRARQPR